MENTVEEHIKNIKHLDPLMSLPKPTFQREFFHVFLVFERVMKHSMRKELVPSKSNCNVIRTL